MSAITALVQELDLEAEELNGLYAQIAGRGIELTGRLRPARVTSRRT